MRAWAGVLLLFQAIGNIESCAIRNNFLFSRVQHSEQLGKLVSAAPMQLQRHAYNSLHEALAVPPSKRRKRDGSCAAASSSRAEALRYLTAEEAKAKLNDAQRRVFVERSVDLATRCSALIHRCAALSERLGCAATSLGEEGGAERVAALGEEGVQGAEHPDGLAQTTTAATLWHAVSQTVAQLERKVQPHVAGEAGATTAAPAAASAADGVDGISAPAPAIVDLFVAEMSRCFEDELAELRRDPAFATLPAAVTAEGEGASAAPAVTMLLDTLESGAVTLDRWERFCLIESQ